MSTVASREVRLERRPYGAPTLEDFSLAAIAVPSPREGEVQVRNRFISVDPYMRGRMNDLPSYVPPFQVGAALDGGAIGEVVASRSPEFRAGDIVTSSRGWRECFVATPAELRKVNAPLAPLSLYLGALGMTGLTAWAGLRLIDVRAGDRVFISGAAGAVGSVAGQLAHLAGCRVVGSAGSAEKVKVLTGELGFDAAFDYRTGDLAGQLATAAPEGIDVYFDLVGGAQLEAALSSMRLHGRVIACGAISQYNDVTPPAGPHNLGLVIGKRLTIKGLIAGDWSESLPTLRKEVGGYLVEGRLQARETVVEGIEQAAQAFLDMMRGGNIGKMVVKVG